MYERDEFRKGMRFRDRPSPKVSQVGGPGVP